MHTLIWNSICTRPLLQSPVSSFHPFFQRTGFQAQNVELCSGGRGIARPPWSNKNRRIALLNGRNKLSQQSDGLRLQHVGPPEDKRGSVDNNYPYLFLLQKHTQAEMVSLRRYNSLVLPRKREDNQYQKGVSGLISIHNQA